MTKAKPDYAAILDLDELLPNLTKHGVSEFTYSAAGVRIRFFAPTDQATQPMRVEPAPIKTEPEAPPTGAVEPAQLDLDDALYGAK